MAAADKPRGPGLQATCARTGARDTVRDGDRSGFRASGSGPRGRPGRVPRRARAGRVPRGFAPIGPFPVPHRPAIRPGPGGAAGTATGARPRALPLSTVLSTVIPLPSTVICQLRRNSHVREP